MNRHRLLALAALSASLAPLTLTEPLHAQPEPVAVRPTHVPPALDSTAADSAAADSVPPPPSCWRARPRPPCDGFFLTDFAFEMPLASTRRADAPNVAEGRRPDIPMRAVWTFGFMGTKGRHSHGGAVSLTSEEIGRASLPFTAEWRYRNWLGTSAAVDAAIGYKSAPMWKNGTGLVPARGMTMMVGFTPNRWVGVSARVDLMRVDGRTPRAVLLGIQSTRVSEEFIRLVAVEMLRAALAKIGFELDEDEEEP